MWRITVPNCEREYENAPNPSCHENRPATQRFSLMNFEELAFTSRTKSERAMSGFKPTSKCRWSGILLMAMSFCF
jgi:hypothetical protein